MPPSQVTFPVKMVAFSVKSREEDGKRQGQGGRWRTRQLYTSEGSFPKRFLKLRAKERVSW